MERNCNNLQGLIVLDWGTTNVRLALLAPNGDIIEERRGTSGVGSFSRCQFETHFDELTEGWPMVPAIAAGMVGSRQGWHEVSYLPCPASPDDLVDSLYCFSHRTRPITIVPGLKILDDNHADVMRGEESQIAGLLTQDPSFTGTLLLPGTHSKWVRIDKGSVSNFKTYMTGELFEALAQHTILQHSLSGDDIDRERFETIANRLAQTKNSVAGQLFGLRARHLLKGADISELHHELSALLIMDEIRSGQIDGFDLGKDVRLIGSGSLTDLYRLILQALGISSICLRGTSLVWPALHSLAMRSGLIEGIKS